MVFVVPSSQFVASWDVSVDLLECELLTTRLFVVLVEIVVDTYRGGDERGFLIEEGFVGCLTLFQRLLSELDGGLLFVLDQIIHSVSKLAVLFLENAEPPKEESAHGSLKRELIVVDPFIQDQLLRLLKDRDYSIEGGEIFLHYSFIMRRN